ncbi:NADP-dependent oxidoreductase [Gordonia sp. TBRC 11910]|uniref:NADP-dependent oxidoreductase n=1 Tax=Gordonia asplenii TaxID=2725283 RepID=A0A848L6G1_9ACTN|nr:NADP-dependent oxidoreductase [Gordonia asplenii]NMO04121.1 NADP-dependent oxidoreductase [Gordonia asplenii]
MRAAVVTTTGGPERIDIVDVARPTTGPGEILIAVTAATINPVDLGTRAGVFHDAGLVTSTGPIGLGWDAAGTVAELGLGVEAPAVGTRVAALAAGVDRPLGAYADYVVVPADAVAVIPDGLVDVDAASIPLNSLTAAQALDVFDPADGRSLLITGAAGAVGGYATQLALRAGWRVTGLARPTDAALIEGFGAAFIKSISAATQFDAVFDTASIVDAALDAVASGGHYVGVTPAFPPAPREDVRIDSVAVRPDGARLQAILDQSAAGELTTRVATTLPLSEAAEGHRLVAKGGLRGRVVLTP